MKGRVSKPSAIGRPLHRRDVRPRRRFAAERALIPPLPARELSKVCGKAFQTVFGSRRDYLGRGVASPSVSLSAHLMASSHMVCMAGSSQDSSVWPKAE